MRFIWKSKEFWSHLILTVNTLESLRIMFIDILYLDNILKESKITPEF